MSSAIIVRTDEQLRKQKKRLLDEVDMTYEQLREYAEEWALTERQLSIWNTIRGIDFLLEDE